MGGSTSSSIADLMLSLSLDLLILREDELPEDKDEGGRSHIPIFLNKGCALPLKLQGRKL
jgi:hypothetical protein